jgi:hypothetical protein
LFGIVRDQMGMTLASDHAEIILLRDGVEIGRGPIWNGLRAELNYELDIRLDAARTSTRLYTDRAVPAQGLFSIAVSLGGQRFYPIEASGALQAGVGGERTRLDLTLGEDTDGDGLPDAWEYWQLYQMGEYPGSPGWDLARVTPGGDLDGDGISNFQEYLAGTFAGDATDRFEMVMKAVHADSVELEFFAITNKVYTIEESSDMETWRAVPFAVSAGGPEGVFHRAPEVRITRAFVPRQPEANRFYRLTVR